MKRIAMGLAVVGFLTGLMLMPAWGQDFQQVYQLASGGIISISNVSGEISITGYNGSSVSVSAIREGRDKDMVQIEDQSTPGHVSLGVKYPNGGGNYEASVRFILQVPRGVRYQFDSLKTASGDISVTGVAGDINAKTASGDITIKDVEGKVTATAASGDVKVLGIAGTVSASTASGDVEVELTRVSSDADLKFSSASGDVTVKAPAQLDAQVEMSTASGSLKTDFPLTIEDREGHGKKATGQLGSGAVKLKISTASGDVQLIRQ